MIQNDISYFVKRDKNIMLACIYGYESFAHDMECHVCGDVLFLPGFFPGGGLGVPQLAKILSIPPIRHLSPFLDQGLSPPRRGSSPKI